MLPCFPLFLYLVIDLKSILKLLVPNWHINRTRQLAKHVFFNGTQGLFQRFLTVSLLQCLQLLTLFRKTIDILLVLFLDSGLLEEVPCGTISRTHTLMIRPHS